MKLKTNISGHNTILSTMSFSPNEKERRNILKSNRIKNLKNKNLTLLLKNEKEKANSTTQTGQKSIIYSKDENKNYNYNRSKILFKSLYNSEKRKEFFNKNSKVFLLNDTLYSLKDNGKFLFLYEKGKNKNNNIISANNSNETNGIKDGNRIKKIKTHNFNKLSLIDICYNSIIYKYNKKNDNFFNKNNIDMYHYYDLNQRRIEKIIPNINEYLNNNTERKKFIKTHFFKFKNDKDINISLSNKNKEIQKNLNPFNYKSKKDKINNIKNRNIQKNKKEEINNNINLCLYNSINNKKIEDDRKLVNINKKNKRDFSCKFPHRKKNKKLIFEKMNLNIQNKEKKVRIGIFSFLSSPYRNTYYKNISNKK